MKEKRKANREASLDPALVEEGSTQLASEIEILEAWIADLDKSDTSDPAVIAARTSYVDMLRSRREMLSALTLQAKRRSSTPPAS